MQSFKESKTFEFFLLITQSTHYTILHVIFDAALVFVLVYSVVSDVFIEIGMHL